jgi:hypothetical protein
MSNMGQYGRALAAYAAEYQDRLASYTWQPDEGPYPTPYEDLRPSLRSPGSATLVQATHILRTRTGWDEYPVQGQGGAFGWVPPMRGGHLPMLDYFDGTLTNRVFACPEDEWILRWQKAAAQNVQRPWEIEPRWPGSDFPWGFFSSYINVPHLWTNDHAMGQFTMTSDTYWGTWQVANNGGGNRKMVGRRKFFEVRFPSVKIATFDEADRHSSRRQICFLYDDAKAPYLFFDGSSRVTRTGDINPGCSPYWPSGESRPWGVSLHVPAVLFLRQRMEPLSGEWERVEFESTRFITTRNGLLGVDVGGGQVSR